MIYLKNVKEYGVQDDDDDEEQSDREEEVSDREEETSDREEQLTWRKITGQFNERFKCNKTKSALKKVYLKRLKDKTIDEIREYVKSANNVITKDVKKNSYDSPVEIRTRRKKRLWGRTLIRSYRTRPLSGRSNYIHI